MKGPEHVARLSVLERLLMGGAATPRSLSVSAEAVRDSVLRDVEYLLNTRQSLKAPDTLPELQNSVYEYGLRDISGTCGDSEQSRRQLIKDVRECVEKFEPRLTSVRVTEAEGSRQARQVQLNIEAMMRIDLDLEPIYFQTVLDPVSGRFNVPKAG